MVAHRVPCCPLLRVHSFALGPCPRTHDHHPPRSVRSLAFSTRSPSSAARDPPPCCFPLPAARCPAISAAAPPPPSSAPSPVPSLPPSIPSARLSLFSSCHCPCCLLAPALALRLAFLDKMCFVLVEEGGPRVGAQRIGGDPLPRSLAQSQIQGASGQQGVHLGVHLIDEQLEEHLHEHPGPMPGPTRILRGEWEMAPPAEPAADRTWQTIPSAAADPRQRAGD